jgi:hypothetical protein
MKNLGIIGSSVDPSKLSTTVSGLIIGASVFIIIIAKYLGFEVGGDQVTAFATQLGTALATLVTVYGIVRKVIVAIHSKFSAPTL